MPVLRQLTMGEEIAELHKELLWRQREIEEDNAEVDRLKAEVSRLTAELEEAKRMWTIQGTERITLEQARYGEGGSLDTIAKLKAEVATLKADLARYKGWLERALEAADARYVSMSEARDRAAEIRREMEASKDAL